jgi:hypothetical protein
MEEFNMKDLYNNIKVENTIAPVVGTNGGAPAEVVIDMAGCNSAVILIATGVEAGTLDGSNYWTFTMTHADDDRTGVAGSYSNVEAADVQGVTPSSGIVLTLDANGETPQITKIGYVGGKRFVKITPGETGTAQNLPQAVITVKGALLDTPPIA